MLKSALRGSATFHLSVFQYPLHITNTAIIRSHLLSILREVERLETAVLGHAVALEAEKQGSARWRERSIVAEYSYCLVWNLLDRGSTSEYSVSERLCVNTR